MILAKYHNDYPSKDEKGNPVTQFVYSLTQITSEELAHYQKYCTTKKAGSKRKPITKAKLKELVDDDGNQLIWSRVSFPFGDKTDLPVIQLADGNLQMDRDFVKNVKSSVESFLGKTGNISAFKDTYWSMKADLVGSKVSQDTEVDSVNPEDGIGML